MRTFWTFLTIGLILVGFFVWLAWPVAIITAMLAIGSAPPGHRPDGKRRTGGLLGGWWDRQMTGHLMGTCPYCFSEILRTSRRCKYCGGTVTDVDPNTVAIDQTHTVEAIDFEYPVYEKGDQVPENTWYQMAHWENKRFVNYNAVIPEGWRQAVMDTTRIAGISKGRRSQNLITVAQAPDFKLHLERDPTNLIDPRALKIFASGTIGGKHFRTDVGYVPAEMLNELDGLTLDVRPHSLFLPPSSDLNVGAKVVLITPDKTEAVGKAVDQLIDQLNKSTAMVK